MQKKALELNIKDLNIQSREVVVMHSAYGTLDKDQDKANRGMFDKSWAENPNIVRFFLNHDKTQAPGKVLQLWDDQKGAYTKAKLGTHTLGEDTLKQLDEGIIQGVSFGFIPIKQKRIKDKGYDLYEVKHLETSVLTHWGAHDDATVISVHKSFDFPSLNLKQLSGDEQGLLRKLIANGMDSIRAAVEIAAQLDTESDLYTYIMYVISRQSDQLGDLRSQLRYGMKAADDFKEQVSKMEKFIRNSTASDDCIKEVQKQLKSLLHKRTDTDNSTDTSLTECPKCRVMTLGTKSADGRIECADCGHMIKGRQPGSSSDKSELRRKLLLLNAKF